LGVTLLEINLFLINKEEKTQHSTQVTIKKFKQIKNLVIYLKN